MVLTEQHLWCLKIPCHLWDLKLYCNVKTSYSSHASLDFWLDNLGLNSKCGWEVQEFSCLQNIHTGSGAHPASYSISAMRFFPQQQRSQDVKFTPHLQLVRSSWNVMAHMQKPDFVFQWNGQVHLNRREHQFSWLLATKVCASAVVMLDTPCSEEAWRVLATHSIHQLPLHFSYHASLCAIRFQLEFNKIEWSYTPTWQHAFTVHTRTLRSLHQTCCKTCTDIFTFNAILQYMVHVTPPATLFPQNEILVPSWQHAGPMYIIWWKEKCPLPPRIKPWLYSRHLVITPPQAFWD